MRRWLIVLVVAPLLSACVSVPAEAPELSQELGKRIAALEETNITLLNRFFDQKRADVDEFIITEWVPTFAENFFENPQISALWDRIVQSGNEADRLDFIVTLGPKLQQKINAKRQELIKPLDDIERKLEQQIRQEYLQARSINNSLTSFLLSAAKVAESRQSFLDKIDVTENRIADAIDKTDQTVAGLLGTAQDTQDKLQKGKTYLHKLAEIRDKV